MFKNALRINGIIFIIYLVIGYLVTGSHPEEVSDMTILKILFGILMGVVTYLLAVLIIRGIGFLIFDVLFASSTRKKKMECPLCSNESISLFDKYTMLMKKITTCYKCGKVITYDERILLPLLTLVIISSLSILHFNFMSCCMDNTFIAIMLAYSQYLVLMFLIIFFVPTKEIKQGRN